MKTIDDALNRESNVGIRSRQEVYDYICRNPGTYRQKIADDLGRSDFSVGYNLDKLLAARLIKFVSDGKRNWYYLMEHKNPIYISRKQLILEIIRSNPWAHLSDIATASGTSNGHASYHLRKLEEKGKIKSRISEKKYRQFAYKDCKESVPVETTCETQEKIRQYLITNPGSNQRKACKALHMSQQLVSYHFAKLRARGLLP